MRFWNNFHLVLSVKIFKSQINLNYVQTSQNNLFIYDFFSGGGEGGGGVGGGGVCNNYI